jgi:dTDP-4-amino-4,6-dideoxygalactose transaminase
LLAIHGGVPVIKSKFKPYNTIGEEEITAVVKVLRTGSLSKFIGAWCDDFYGGPQIQAFEYEWQKYFGVKNAIAVNSWTSGLTAAIGAIGIEPGDEVIVSPWTMAASATSILHWNAIPIFADISLDDFCLDPKSVEAAITPYTKAIMIVDIFGQSADMEKFKELAEKHKLLLISDSAQSPGALYRGAMAGTISDIGGYSLNYHKHIHTGEGGMVVTNNDEFAERVRLIRNHAEAVVGDKGTMDLTNMIGYNYRMGEIEAAIGREQLKKFPNLLISRQKAAVRIIDGLKNISGIILPVESIDRTHAFYVLPLVLQLEKLTADRHEIYRALRAEGLEGISEGYVNLHLLPMYQKKLAYGSKGFPWVSGIVHRDVDYRKGICPVAEKLHSETFLELEICRFELNDQEIDLIIETFKKVFRFYAKK